MAEINRRTFIQLSVLSTAAATVLTGCKNEAIWKEEATGQYGGTTNKVFPYVDQPADSIDGVPVYYATTCQMCSAGCGLYVRTLGGRAKKIEGNPHHPVNAGKTCLRGELALQHLYNPDRAMHPLTRGSGRVTFERTDWESALNRTVNGLKPVHGRVAILVDGVTVGRSSSKLALVHRLGVALGATVVEYSLFDDRPLLAACQHVYGKQQAPDYRIDLADLVVSFGANFLESWPSPVHYGNLFGEFRQAKRRKPGDHGEFIYVGPRLSMTAAKADQWIPCNPGTESAVASGILGELGVEGLPLEQASAISGVKAQQLNELAYKVKEAGVRAVALGGDGLFAGLLPTLSFIAVESINAAVRSDCVQFGSTPLTLPDIKSGFAELKAMIDDMSANKYDALVTVGDINPAYVLPESIGWQQARSRVGFVASLCSFQNETSVSADVLLPTRTFLEEWGDVIPSVLPGNTELASLTQPVIDPSFITIRHDIGQDNQPVPMMDTRELGDILMQMLQLLDGSNGGPDIHRYVRESWSTSVRATDMQSDIDNDRKWSEVVSAGGFWISGTRPVAPSVKSKTVYPPIFRNPNAVPQTYSLLLYPHIYYGDGRHANLGWAQEMPDPMTSAVWNSWIEINATVAHELGIRTGDIVKISSANGSIDLPAIPFPGLHPSAVAIPIGQGHTLYGRNASGCGVNPLQIIDPIADPQTGALAYSATLVTIQKLSDAVAGYHPELKTLVLTQDRPGGAEPPAVKGLIHETAKEWKARTVGEPATPGNSPRSRPVI